MPRFACRPIPEKNLARLLADGLPPLLARLYAGRGIASTGQLNTNLEALAPPFHAERGLKGVDVAASILGDAIRLGRRIVIVADFDCDGATSCALCMEALTAMGAVEPAFIVPNRFDYGYGLTPEIVELAKPLRPDILLTVDNGISSISGVAAAKAAGMTVVVTDHHLPGAQLPQADAIVNPNQPGCPFPGKHSAGVGVAFYTMLAVRTYLREQGFFSPARPEPKFGGLLDLLALGTVADVVPLDDNNRIFVAQGLARMNAGLARPGLRALFEVAGRAPGQLNAADLGFMLGPRLNAAGRLADMALGIRCLLTQDFEAARGMARQLDELNRERRAIEDVMQAEAQVRLLHETGLTERWGLCLYDEAWHQGVIGILAGRIKEQMHKPVIAFAKVGEKELKGSARSIRGLHLRDTLDAVAARHPGLLTKFGGHAMAAGLSLRLEDLPAFADAFDQQVRASLRPEDLEGVLETDGELAAEELSLETAQLLAKAGPWGQGFPEPRFEGVFDLLDFRIMKEKHLKFWFRGRGGEPLEAVHFNAIAQFGMPESGRRLHLAYVPEVNEFRGEARLQLRVFHWEHVD